jgi:hypothetical protein
MTGPGYDPDVPRHFRPSFVHHADGIWVAVDDLQPVAVALDQDGAVLDVVSWRDVPAPREITWPWRQVQALGSTVWVHDRPAGPTVRIEVVAGGRLAVTPSEPAERAPGMTVTYNRFSRSGASPTAGWRFASNLADHRWTAEVHRDGAGSWPLGPGSIIDWATAGTTAAVCVRRADKRPWAFRPAHDLVLVGGPDGPVTALPGGLDVTELCWPLPDHKQVALLLARYLPFTVAECRTVLEAGGTDVGFSVRDLDGLPRIETTFRLDPAGPRFVHVDEPVDELGRPTGLSFFTVLLDEDINGSPLYERASETDAPIYL